MWEWFDDINGAHLSGIHNLENKNRALLVKWLWRFPLEKDNLWHEVIRRKYGLDSNGSDAKKVSCGALKVLGKLFQRNMNLKLAIVSQSWEMVNLLYFGKING